MDFRLQGTNDSMLAFAAGLMEFLICCFACFETSGGL